MLSSKSTWTGLIKAEGSTKQTNISFTEDERKWAVLIGVDTFSSWKLLFNGKSERVLQLAHFDTIHFPAHRTNKNIYSNIILNNYMINLSAFDEKC